MDEFLPWIKDLQVTLQGRPDCCNLMGSGIREPAEALRQLLREQQAVLQQRLAVPNEWGHPALLAGLARRYNLPPEKDLLITAGATAAFYVACQALLAPGDHVLVESPGYEPLHLVPAQLGAAVAALPRRPEAGYQPDPDELAALVTPRTRLVVLTNLHNPSGTVLADETLQALARAARRANPAVMVLVDETFHDFHGDAYQSSARLGPDFITVSTLTKVYGLGLLRCGWVAADPEVMKKVRRAWIASAGIGSRLTEAIASVVVDHLAVFEAHWRAVLVANRPLLQEHLGPLRDRGLLRGDVLLRGCVCFPEVVGVTETDSLVRDLAEVEGVHVVPGRFFQAPGHIRIGFGGEPARLAEGLRRLAEGLTRRGGTG
jgi:aspartate/methionine/tyrosine aminotransferase